MKQLKSLEKWLFPPRCVLSGQATQQWDLAEAYLAKLSRPGESGQPFCPICADRLTVIAEACGQCLHTPPAFDRTQAGFYYTAVMQDLIHAFKYDQQLPIGRLLAQLWQPQLDMSDIDAIIPVPLHDDRLCERGFNQALELANGLAKNTQITVLPFALKRVKATASQALLDAEQRQHNLKGAFAMDDTAEFDLAGCRQVAILDDVLTTGATLNQVALTLKAAFPHLKVQAWALARSQPRSHD